MKPFNLILLLVFSQIAAREVKVRVMDELGSPVVGAKSSIYFVNARHDDLRAGLTDKNGVFSASGSSTNSFGFIITKEGHYQARVEGLSKDRDHDVEVVLPRIINPISLFAMRINTAHRRPGEEMTFPVHDQWVGFDLEVADWVAPHGKGKTADFLLRFKNEFKGWKDWLASDIDSLMAETKELAKRRNEDWTIEKFKMRSGKWDGLVEMSFPGEGDGIIEAKRFIGYSPMKLPHCAPDDGYSSAWKRMANNYDGIILPEDTGFFLRTRVKRDQKGQIISANYSKFIGRMNVMANTGRIEFFYYFNPTPNDRNLEFDPKKNLFPKDKPGANVYDP